jgi:transcriptional regulator GlxA family with amidase domain
MASQHRAVRRAEDYVRGCLDTRVPLSRLCQVAGVSERGLRNAFYRVHGMGPQRWMLTERLRRVRRALTSPGPRSATVTEVATDYGFSELGRFAATYRQAFGEVPSATLRAAARESMAKQHAQHMKGHADAGTR